MTPLQRLRALLDASTKGPYSVQHGDIWCDSDGRPNAPLFRPATEYRRWGREISQVQHEANAAFIAAARNQMDRLLAVAEAAERVIAHLWHGEDQTVARPQDQIWRKAFAPSSPAGRTLMTDHAQLVARLVFRAETGVWDAAGNADDVSVCAEAREAADAIESLQRERDEAQRMLGLNHERHVHAACPGCYALVDRAEKAERERDEARLEADQLDSWFKMWMNLCRVAEAQLARQRKVIEAAREWRQSLSSTPLMIAAEEKMIAAIDALRADEEKSDG